MLRPGPLKTSSSPLMTTRHSLNRFCCPSNWLTDCCHHELISFLSTPHHVAYPPPLLRPHPMSFMTLRIGNETAGSVPDEQCFCGLKSKVALEDRIFPYILLCSIESEHPVASSSMSSHLYSYANCRYICALNRTDWDTGPLYLIKILATCSELFWPSVLEL